MELKAFLQSQRLFTLDECLTISQAFQSETIPKGTIVTKADRYGQKAIFVESGLLRTFYLKEEKEITHFFFDENSLMAPINSIYNKETEPYSWETLEDCQLKTIFFNDFLALQDEIPKLTRLLLSIALDVVHLYSQKLDLLQFQTAVERYQIFQEMYPNLLNRVSLGSTASFLGITQQTLSVIRGKK